MHVSRSICFAVALACLALPATAAQPPGLPSYAEPAISPDHREVAFVSGGDIWSVSAEGGTARLLVAGYGTTSRPLYSPDGKRLAFTSNKTGTNNVFVLTLEGGDLRQLTFDDGGNQIEGWSPDGAFVYFSTSAHNISYDDDIYRVAATGGTPMPVVDERYVNQYDAAPSPDGTKVAYVAGGFANAQWWRRGHAHIDETSIATKTLHGDAYVRVTPGGAKDLWPMWSPDSRALYFVSDRDGNDNLYELAPGGKPHKLTAFTTDRVLWPTISRDGRTIVFERQFGIWSYDVASGSVKELTIERRGLPADVGPVHETIARQEALALSPDGKKVAFVARGQIFAASAKDGGDGERVTHTFGNEALPVWSADSRKIAYVSDRDGAPNLYLYDFGSGTETALTHGAERNTSPLFSPDGTTLAYIRGGRQLRLIDLATKTDRELAQAEFSPYPLSNDGALAFSPGGDWIAYISDDGHGFSNVRVVKTSGGASHPVSFLGNGYSTSVQWSPDGTRLFFVSAQRTEDGQVVEVDLIRRTPEFREDAFRDLFRAAPHPVPHASGTSAARTATIDFDGIRERATLLPTGIDAGALRISPDGKTLVISASAAGEDNLFAYTIDPLARGPVVARQLTSTTGRKSSVQFDPDGSGVTYLENGRAFTIALDGRTPPRALPLSAELDVDFARDKAEMFEQAWSYLNNVYYDPHFHGTNWNAVHATYEPHILGARTPAEVRRILNLMVGELNSSHSGVGGPYMPYDPTGYLGVRYDPATYAETGKLRISEVIPLGPADVTRKIGVGDDLLAVDGTAVDAHTNLEALLANREGKRTVLTIAPHGDVAAKREVAVLPTDRGTEKALIYRAWVEGRRAYVEKASGGRLGYVHIMDMSSESLEQLYIDLDTQNQSREGVIVDIRNNTGGFIAPYAVDVLSRRDAITFTSRVDGHISERRRLGQRALLIPTVLLTNEHALSDAENFTEDYRHAHLGKIVGEPTAGWIIFTGSAGLIDGSSVRLPFWGTYAADGTDMELHPRPVDVRVERKLGEADHGGDVQLDAAIRELLKSVKH